uniref:Uncharacterized protein n=1 Tax=Anguilla anguilla TaxID=7936 RepID=A0A0E9TNI7_ANGAN
MYWSMACFQQAALGHLWSHHVTSRSQPLSSGLSCPNLSPEFCSLLILSTLQLSEVSEVRA